MQRILLIKAFLFNFGPEISHYAGWAGYFCWIVRTRSAVGIENIHLPNGILFRPNSRHPPSSPVLIIIIAWGSRNPWFTSLTWESSHHWSKPMVVVMLPRMWREGPGCGTRISAWAQRTSSSRSPSPSTRCQPTLSCRYVCEIHLYSYVPGRKFELYVWQLSS